MIFRRKNKRTREDKRREREARFAESQVLFMDAAKQAAAMAVEVADLIKSNTEIAPKISKGILLFDDSENVITMDRDAENFFQRSVAHMPTTLADLFDGSALDALTDNPEATAVRADGQKIVVRVTITPLELAYRRSNILQIF